MSTRYTSDRRRAPRLAQAGRVELTFEDPTPATVEAELIEMSSMGFRASYASKGLAPGLEVRYRRADLSGRARVMWTHILEGNRVSGFLILGR
jgi:hypothetical protein